MLTNDKNLPRGQISVTELKNNERQLCEIWTRVMGYFRPLSEFNKGKKAEFLERKNVPLVMLPFRLLNTRKTRHAKLPA